MKPITLTQEQMELMHQQLQTQLESFKSSDLSKTPKITLNFPTVTALGTTPEDNKPFVGITPEASLKCRALIDTATGEVGWHGLVRRQGNIFVIYDIIIYPQTVTAATVTTDDLEYAEWLQSHPDDIFFNIRMHGHSHVNMGCSPSQVDLTFYDKLLQNLGEEDYYIFMINNKKGDTWILLYDRSVNTIYEKEDIDMDTLFKGNVHMKDWMLQAKDNISKSAPPPPVQTTTYYGSYGAVDRTPKPDPEPDPGLYESDLEYYRRLYGYCNAEAPTDKEITEATNRGRGRPKGKTGNYWDKFDR